MKQFVTKVISRHKTVWEREFGRSVGVGFLFVLVSMLINNGASTYATEKVSFSVTDILLNNLPVFDVDGIVIYGSLALIFFVLLLVLIYPKKLPFILKSGALFILIRSIFISLTHIAPFYPRVAIDPSRILQVLGLGYAADLFFSGHTGFPFLLALIFWENKTLRGVFLLTSLGFAVTVILGHIHYSIDVFAAFFITYTIFQIAKKFFRKDWQTALS